MKFPSVQALKDFLTKRQQSYRTVFDAKGDAQRRVLKDLARFCRANEPTFHENERLHSLLEGRREVWLRIMEHIQMPTHEFIEKHGGKESDE